VTSVKYHGVDPVGRPFVYVRMHNVSRRAGRRNEGGAIYTFPVIIRPRNRPAWNLTPRAFARRSNWNQTRRKHRNLFHPDSLMPTNDTMIEEAKPIESRKNSRSSLAQQELLLRPAGYPQNTYLAEMTVEGFIRALGSASTRSHWHQPLVLRDPWDIKSEPIPDESDQQEGACGCVPISAPPRGATERVWGVQVSAPQKEAIERRRTAMRARSTSSSDGPLFTPGAMLFEEPPRRIIVLAETNEGVDLTVGDTEENAVEVDTNGEVEVDEETAGQDDQCQVIPPMDLTNLKVQVDNRPAAASAPAKSRRPLTVVVTQAVAPTTTIATTTAVGTSKSSQEAPPPRRMFAVDEPCVTRGGANAFPGPVGIVERPLQGVGRGITKTQKERAPGNPSQPTVTMGSQLRPHRTFDPREAGVTADNEKALRDLLRDMDLVDSLNLQRMMEGIIVATQAPLHLALVAKLADLTATHTRIAADHFQMTQELAQARNMTGIAEREAAKAQKSEQKARDDVVSLKAKLVDAQRCGAEHLRDSHSYKSQLVVAEEARSCLPGPPVGNDQHTQLKQEHAELKHQYLMLQGLFAGSTTRVKTGQEDALKLREQARTIAALEAQLEEQREKLAAAEKDRKWAMTLWTQYHPPSATPPSPGSPAQPKPPGSPPQ